VKRLLTLGLPVCLLAAAACGDVPSTGAAKAAEPNPVVVMETAKGTIKIELFADKAPITVKNFLTYVDEKFYDGTTFHRVMPEFMIQGGGFLPGLADAKTEDDVQKLEKKTHDPIKNEASNGLHNERGAVAMARTPKPDSATAQFFINVVDNTNKLDPSPKRDPAGYCVFGKVIDGMDVVDAIKEVRTKAVIPDVVEDVPVKDVLIKSVRRADKDKDK
jgi:cyclophilin family peptidyl-prolyl cis-trans isomerase